MRYDRDLKTKLISFIRSSLQKFAKSIPITDHEARGVTGREDVLTLLYSEKAGPSGRSLLSTLLIAGSALALSACGVAQSADTDLAVLPDLAPVETRLPEDEIIYFVMPDRFENGNPDNDRGGIDGDRLDHGFDPTHTGFYHGGDLQGLTDQLDYIRGLGATAIWLTPIFENKPVQGPPGLESSGYHGYWITDFTNVDPHLGTRDDFRAFVDAAHAKGMKVYMDIITNHTADVIKYQECHGPDAPEDLRSKGDCPYRSLGDYPYTTRGGPDGEPINEGFLGDDPRHQTPENFARLTDTDHSYSVFIPEDEVDVKVPAWLNDPVYYHNRGHTTWRGEDSLYGDFAGLDDLMTSHPKVVDGMIEIYKQWITEYRVDGFRIDTAKHVNPAFWTKVIPALEAHAASLGIEHFHIFGEVYEFDPGQLAVFTHRDDLPTVLDFAFQGAVRSFVIDGAAGESLDRLFKADHVYADSARMGRRLPTFLGNHDMGRFAGMVREAFPDADSDEVLARTRLAHGMMLMSRGVPTIYYGDEQGFVSDGGDQGAREPLFESQVGSYNDNTLLGTDKTTADRNFDMDHPLYRAIREMSALRLGHEALRRGEQIVRHADLEESLFVMSRFDPADTAEYVIAANAETTPKTIRFPVDGRSLAWSPLLGECAAKTVAPGTYEVTIPALGMVVCRSGFGEDGDGE